MLNSLCSTGFWSEPVFVQSFDLKFAIKKKGLPIINSFGNSVTLPSIVNLASDTDSQPREYWLRSTALRRGDMVRRNSVPKCYERGDKFTVDKHLFIQVQ